MGSKQGSLWQSRKMDHNSSYRGPIWVIQNPNVKFTDAATISMKDTSPISPFFPIENQSQNLDSMWGHFHITCQYKNTRFNNQIFSKDVSTKCETPRKSNFLKNGKMVILVKIRNFSRSRMTKRTSPLESSHKI